MRALASVILLGTLAHADEPLVALHASQGGDRHGHAAVSLVIAPAAGMHLLDDGPLTLDVVGDTTRNLRREDAVDPRAETPRFEIALGKSETTLRAHLLAWVCKARRCRPVEITEDIPVTK